MKKLIKLKAVVVALVFACILLLISIRQRTFVINTEFDKASKQTVQNLRSILSTVEEENRKRIKCVEEVCKKHNIGIFKNTNISQNIKYPPTPQFSVFYFDTENNIAYCPTYKAGSTTWLYNLLKLNGVKDETIEGKQISVVAREVFPELDGDIAEHKLHQSKRLLCVRHPFERVLSAYRDKLEDKDKAPEHGTRHFYKRWGSRIRQKYRNSGQLEPTFEEFVRYLIETDLLLYADDHWIPYNAYCTPCLLRYDFIAKVETLTEDQLFFFHKLGLPSWLTPTRRHSSSQISSTATRKYYSQITKEQLYKLYKKFYLDFEMFGYSIELYLKFVKD